MYSCHFTDRRCKIRHEQLCVICIFFSDFDRGIPVRVFHWYGIGIGMDIILVFIHI